MTRPSPKHSRLAASWSWMPIAETTAPEASGGIVKTSTALLHLHVATAEQLQGRRRVEVGGEQQRRAVVERDADPVVLAGLTVVDHGDLQGEAAPQACAGREVGQVGLGLEVPV